MPTTSRDITGAADRTLVSVTIPLEGGVLVSAAAFPLVTGTDPADNWAEIGLMSDETELQNRVGLLDAGYLGTSAPVGWTGHILGQPSLYIYLHLYSSASTIVRLALITEAI